MDETSGELNRRLAGVEHKLTALDKDVQYLKKDGQVGKRARIRQARAIKEIQENVKFVRWLATLIAVGFALFQAFDWMKGHIK